MIRKGGFTMTEDLIKKLKDVKQALVSKDMTGEEWEEREEILRTLAC